jgi:WD40 repeat protein
VIFALFQKDNSVTLSRDNSVANVSVKPDLELMVKPDGEVIGIITSNGTIVIPDRKLEEIRTNNGTIEVFQQLDNGRIEPSPDLRGPLISIEFSQDGKTINGKDKDGKSKTWNLDDKLIPNP